MPDIKLKGVTQIVSLKCFRKVNFVDAKSFFYQISEISEPGTFISDGLISSRKCPILMVDPALDS